jgi:hypothetical protein
MRDSASIKAKSSDREVLFQWNGFDGDDCFKDFHIQLLDGPRFCFGECMVRGLRQCVWFFRGQLDKVELGFESPDIRTCYLTRTEDAFLLQICLEGLNRSEQYCLSEPTLTLDDEFLREYDSD